MSSTASSKPRPQDLINRDRYPITSRDSKAYRDLVATCRAQLADIGASEIPEFTTAAATAAMCVEADELARVAFRSTVVGNAWLTPIDETLPADDPRRMTESTTLGAVAYDQFPKDSLTRMVYEWDPLREFIADVLSVPVLHRYGDPMGALNISVMEDGDYLRWHFDQTDFVTSIALQTPESGGEFEFVPRIRQPGNENLKGIRSLLKGDRTGVRTIANHPGTLLLFQGRYSIHRVTPIGGKKLRHMALLGYDTKPGVMSSEHLHYMRYGRTVAGAGKS